MIGKIDGKGVMPGKNAEGVILTSIDECVPVKHISSFDLVLFSEDGKKENTINSTVLVNCCVYDLETGKSCEINHFHIPACLLSKPYNFKINDIILFSAIVGKYKAYGKDEEYDYCLQQYGDFMKLNREIMIEH